MRFKRLLIPAMFVLANMNVFGQATPKYSNEFLNIGVGGAAFGMSNSVIAGVDDVTAGYWNPSALLRQDDKLQLAYMHTNYFGGVGSYDYGALGIKLANENAIGISFVRLGIDGIPNTLDLFRNGQLDYDRISEFSAVDYSFIFSYAQPTAIDRLNIGASAKLVHRKAGDFAKAWGFGVDLGLNYTTLSNWKFGLTARDITSTFNAWKFEFTDAEKDVLFQTGNEIPENSLEITLPKFLAGVGKEFKLSEEIDLYSELGFDITTDGKRNVLLRTDVISVDPHIGIQLDYNDLIYLRGGIGNIQEGEDIEGQTSWTLQPNVGLGLHLNKFALDYAMSDIGDVSQAQYSHVFSIRFNLADKTEDQ